MSFDLVPELIVEDVTRSINFYTSILGFELEMQAPDTGTPTWAQITKGSVRFMFQAWRETKHEMPSLAKRPKGGITIFVFKLGDKNQVKEIANNLANQNVVLPIRETDYGSIEFGISDPDGYVIIFSGE